MAEITTENPVGLDGFEFLEFSSPDVASLENQFASLGFVRTGQHKTLDIARYQQGQVTFLINNESGSEAVESAGLHGAGACSMGFRVKNAQQALQRACELGAKASTSDKPCLTKAPAIVGIGGSLIYFVDDYEQGRVYQDDFEPVGASEVNLSGHGLATIDHLTHNVHRGNMDDWADFYTRIFNFQQIRFFDIQGLKTGLISRAMGSPCGKIKIPLNEATDPDSQIEEFLTEYNGEGIQHIALSSEDIYLTVPALREAGIDFLTVPNTYFEMIDERLPGHGESVAALEKDSILIDGGEAQGGGILLQIFTENMLGPAFFEIIQRKGNDGFGEGNFQALFESIERDQIKRGVLKAD